MAKTGSTAQVLDTSLDRSLVSLSSPAVQLVQESYRKSGIEFHDYAKQVILYAESTNEVARRALTKRRLDFLRDSWKPLLKASLQNWVSNEVFNALTGKNQDHLDISRNPAKHIWQELSVTYKYPPKRSTPDQKDDVEKYNKILEGTGFDIWWQLVELTCEACNDVLIYPDVVTLSNGEKQIKHRMATGARATVICSEDDPTVVECVCLVDEISKLDGEKYTTYKIWTNEWYGTFKYNKADGAVERIDLINPALWSEDPERDFSVKNPYGRLPFYAIRLNPWDDCFWDQTSGEDLIDLTIKTGEDRVFYRYLQKMSGFKQAAVVGEIQEDMPQNLLDPGAVAQFITSGQLQIVDWQLDLKARLDCMVKDEVLAASSRGISPQRYSMDGGSTQSAQSAQLSERGLDERRIHNSPIFKEAERQYKKMLCIVAKAHGVPGEIPDPEIKLDVEHAPLAYPSDPAAQLAVDTASISMALESQVSILLRRYPTWTEKEAREHIEKNMDVIAWVSEMKATRNIPNDPTNVSASAEQNGRLGPIVRDKSQSPPDGSSPSNKPDVNGENQNVSK